MERIHFETYKGKKVLIEDFTNLRPGPDFLQTLDKAQKTIASQPSKSVLAVFDASGSTFNGEILNAMKDFTKANTPFIKAAAVVGITGLLQIALTTVSKFAGREFVTFKTREDAMNWLVER